MRPILLIFCPFLQTEKVGCAPQQDRAYTENRPTLCGAAGLPRGRRAFRSSHAYYYRSVQYRSPRPGAIR